MNTSLKKAIASGSAIALLAMNTAHVTLVDAAAVNNATAVVTAGQDIVVTSA